MTFERPPRLKDGQLGPILRAADREMSPERLAKNGARVKQLLAAGGTLALWKLLVVLGILGALAIPLALHGRGGDDRPVPEVAAYAPPAIDAPAALPVDAAVAEVAIDAAPEPVAAPPHHHHVVATVTADAGEPDAPPPAPSDLPEQIALYDAARTAEGGGDHATAIARIDELLRRYPATQLRADAELTRADLLARAGRVADAIAAFEVLVADDGHRGRRGEMLRTLGDLYRRSGDCTRAIEAYRRALAEKLSARDRADAERGRDHCTPP
jgi:TolA-binding protein